MAVAGPPRQPSAGERRFLALLPFALLAAALAISVGVHLDDGGGLWATAGLTGLTAAWIAWWVTLHPSWRGRPRRMGVFFAGLLVLLAALISLAPWFGFAVFAAYFYIGEVPRRWQMPATAGAAVLIGTSQSGGWPGTDGAAPVWAWAGLVAINLLVSAGVMWYSLRSEEREREREQLIAELQRVNARLEAALAANDALQAELVDRAREAGVVEERQRMAREIHDTLPRGSRAS
jgi:signal transduction histidine kinase